MTQWHDIIREAILVRANDKLGKFATLMQKLAYVTQEVFDTEILRIVKDNAGNPNLCGVKRKLAIMRHQLFGQGKNLLVLYF